MATTFALFLADITKFITAPIIQTKSANAICLRPSNSQGGYYFLNIETGKRIHGYNFTELAMPDYIIDRLHQLAEQEHAPELDADGCPIFEWELGVPFEANNPIIPPDQLSGDDLSIDDESYHLHAGKADYLMECDEIQEKLEKALLTLPEKQRAVFHMRYYEDMKYTQMSEVVGTSVGALKASYHIAVKKIENYLIKN